LESSDSFWSLTGREMEGYKRGGTNEKMNKMRWLLVSILVFVAFEVDFTLNNIYNI
jgi:hypothetical protein